MSSNPFLKPLDTGDQTDESNPFLQPLTQPEPPKQEALVMPEQKPTTAQRQYEHEMQAADPSVMDRIGGLFSGQSKAAASNELAAREIARKQGIDVGEVYQNVGGYRPFAEGYRAANEAAAQAGSEALFKNSDKDFTDRIGEALPHGWDAMVTSLQVGRDALVGGDPRETAKIIDAQFTAGSEKAKNRTEGEASFYGSMEQTSASHGIAEFLGSATVMAKEFFGSPEDAAVISAEQMPNMVPALGLGATGAAAGGAVGNAPGAVIGGKIGLATGTAAVEFGAELQEAITEEIGDSMHSKDRVKAIEEVLRDPDFMAQAKKRAAAKGLTVAAIDQIFLGLSGKLANKTGVTSKVGAVALDATGESVGEVASQLAARGEVDAGEAVLEGMASGPTSIIETGIGAAAERYKATESGKRKQAFSELDQEIDQADIDIDADAQAREALNPNQYPPTLQPEDVSSEAAQENNASPETEAPQADTQPAQNEAINTRQPSPEQNETGIYRVKVNDLQVDPEQYQFRTKVNKDGVDNRLEGIEKWDDTRAGVMLVHRRKDGSMYIADGHHRIDLARRTKQEGVNVRIYDEADGYSVKDMRILAAMNNIADGKAEATDVAKVIRESDKTAKDIRKEHNLPNSQLIRDGQSLSKLSDNVFGMVVNGQLPDKDGAAIGGALEESQHDAAADVFQKVKPQTAAQREMLINEIRAAEFAKSQGDQGGLFGDDPQEISLMQDRLKVLENLKGKLNSDKRLFNTLNEHADKAQEAGNVIAKDANEEITERSRQALDLINRVATTPALNEMVNKATRRVYDGEAIGTVVKDLKKELIGYERTEKPDTKSENRNRSSEQADSRGLDNRPSEPVSQADDAGSDGSRQSEAPQEELLSDYTEDELAQQASERKAKQEAEAEAKRKAEEKEKADRDRDSFSLSGSDLPADANPNQNDMFGNTEVTSAQKPPEKLEAVESSGKPKSSGSSPKSSPEQAPSTEGVSGSGPAKVISKNTVFTDDAADKARALLRKKLGQMNTGIDPEIMQAGITLAGYHIEKGARTFAAYARAMVEDMGDSVKPYLKSWYMGVKYDPRATEFEGMSAADEVEKADIDAAIKQEDTTDAEYSATDQKPDSERNAEPTAQADILDDGRGAERQRAVETGEETSGAGNNDSQSLGDSRADADRESSNKPLRNEKPRVDERVAGSNDDTSSLADSTGGLFAELETDAAAQGIVEQATDQKGKLGKQAGKANFKYADADQIRQRMPFLDGGQVEDIVKAELRFQQPDGYGMLFTNGTGTGKTFTGLGIARRFMDRGKNDILVVVPKQTIADGWIKAGRDFFGIDVNRLEDTNDAGKGVVVTTYANIGDNDAIVSRHWDLVIPDESHYLSSDQKGSTTKALSKLRAITEKDGTAFARIYAQNRKDADRLKFLMEEMGRLHEQGTEQAVDLAEQFDTEAEKISDKLDDLVKAEKQRLAKLKPEEKARVTFLSATPFAYDKNIQIGQEFLFDWGDDRGGSGSKSYNHADNYQHFMQQHFGYRMRYGKLTTPDAGVDSTLMERAFNAYLKKEGVLSGRMLDSDFDYDRRFILAQNPLGRRVDEVIEWLRDTDGDNEVINQGKSLLYKEMIDKNFKYHKRMYFLEAIKAREVLPHIQKYLELGKKVVVMHDFKKGGTRNPFRLDIQPGAEPELVAAYTEFKQKFGDLIKDFSSLPSPITTLREAYPDALIYNGDYSAKERVKMQNDFNKDDDDSPHLIIAQGDAMREGVSIHDTTGKKQRVLLHLGMPVKPTAAIQQEGRIYRVGQASDAVFRYMTIGSNWERYAFASTIAQRASTAENLAMGEYARGLKESFIQAYELAGRWPAGMKGEGKGGKAIDKQFADILTPWDMAKSYYYGTKKQGSGRSSAGREGRDYFATPEPVGLKMVQWANTRANESVLEPSAGHGAIGRWLPDNTNNKAIEQSDELASQLALRFNGDVLTGNFEDHNIMNKYDAIVMNPPYGQGGKTAADHVRKAIKHLRDGGRIVALVPTGPAADKRFDKLLYPQDEKSQEAKDVQDIYVAADIKLPQITFERAGTKVATKILILDKQTDKDLVSGIQQQNRDYSSVETVKELFDRIEDAEIRPRTKPVDEEDAPKRNNSARVEIANDAPSSGGYDFVKMDSKHSKKGHDLFVVNMKGDMGDNYDRLNSIAKKHAGFYIRAKLRNYYKPKDGGKASGQPTFTFESAESRQSFLDEVTPSARRSSENKSEAISRKELDNVVYEFMQDYNGNIPVEFLIVDNEESAYGPAEGTERYTVDASYHAASGQVVIVRTNIRNEKEARRSLTHELLGHYGLNTFRPEDKKAVLQRILNSKNARSLKPIWEKVAELYSDISPMKQAEEVFAFTVEQRDSAFKKLIDLIAAPLTRALRNAGIIKSEISKSEIREIARRIGQGIRDGNKQQTFPKSDNHQFSRKTKKQLAKRQNFGDIKIEERMKVEGGEDVVVSIPAQRMYDQLQKRRSVLEQLRECLL